MFLKNFPPVIGTASPNRRWRREWPHRPCWRQQLVLGLLKALPCVLHAQSLRPTRRAARCAGGRGRLAGKRCCRVAVVEVSFSLFKIWPLGALMGCLRGQPSSPEATNEANHKCSPACGACRRRSIRLVGLAHDDEVIPLSIALLLNMRRSRRPVPAGARACGDRPCGGSS